MSMTESFHLVPHPDTPSAAVSDVRVTVSRGRNLQLDFRVVGDTAAIRWPGAAAPDRTDGLWRHTCFEAFVSEGAGYREFNLSPSGAWAAYAFDGYRDAMRDAPATVAIVPGDAGLSATIAADLPATASLGLSAVIELVDGSKSYWALAHPPGAPDFHAPACFAAELPAPRGA